ncbi:ROK family protein [soil metagenome]
MSKSVPLTDVPNRGPATAVADCGGTATKVGLVISGRVLRRESIPSQSDRGLSQLLDRLPAVLERLCRAAEIESIGSLRGIGLSLPVIVDRSGKVTSALAGKFDDSPSLDLGAWAKRALGLSVRIENDANAACLGEWRFGSGRGCENFVIVTLGTGIGTSTIINGRPLRGANGQAGILGGHLIVSPNGRPCGHGGRGCIESEVGSAALAELVRDDPRLAKSGLSAATNVDYANVFTHAAAGDELATHFRDRALNYWGAALVNLIHSYDPSRIAVGGGIMASSEIILPALRQFVRDNAWCSGGVPEIMPATAGDDAALLGMETLFTQATEYS